MVFRWKDYRTGGEEKTTSLAGVEFVRRFLQHVLPRSFQRIRYYGLLANRHRQNDLYWCRLLLRVATADSEPGDAADEGNETSKPEGSEPGRCPACGEGRMILRLRIPASAGWAQSRAPPASAPFPV